MGRRCSAVPFPSRTCTTHMWRSGRPLLRLCWSRRMTARCWWGQCWRARSVAGSPCCSPNWVQVCLLCLCFRVSICVRGCAGVRVCVLCVYVCVCGLCVPRVCFLLSPRLHISFASPLRNVWTGAFGNREEWVRAAIQSVRAGTLGGGGWFAGALASLPHSAALGRPPPPMLVTVQALDKHRDAPLDVKLVHYGHVEAFYRPIAVSPPTTH